MDSVLANLESHVTEHALVERAALGFRSWVDDASNDITPLLPDDGSPGQLSSELESISLCFRPATGTFQSVTITMRDGRAQSIRATEDVKGERVAEILKSADFQDIEVKQRDGEVVKLTRTILQKL